MITMAGISLKVRRAFNWLIEARGYDRYPISLRFLWFIMHLGIRTDGISSLAHRIYDQVEGGQ